MRKGGFEPPRAEAHKLLRPLRFRNNSYGYWPISVSSLNVSVNSHPCLEGFSFSRSEHSPYFSQTLEGWP